jgi:ribosome-interacting GTPase 1
LYIEEALSETKEKAYTRIRISTIRFADDIVIISESENNLNEMLIEMERVLVNRYNMKINRNKTKVMVCGRKISGKMNIVLGNQILGEVEEFCYLGSKITKDGKC